MSNSLSIDYENHKYITAPNTPLTTFLKANNLRFPLVIKVNNIMYDLTYHLTTSCTLIPVYFEDDDGKYVFWHSSAHVLGYAITKVFPGALLTSGPPTANGFYYDVKLNRNVTQEDYALINSEANKIIKANYKFIRTERTKQELLKMYKDNKYKTYYVTKSFNQSNNKVEDVNIDLAVNQSNNKVEDGNIDLANNKTFNKVKDGNIDLNVNEDNNETVNASKSSSKEKPISEKSENQKSQSESLSVYSCGDFDDFCAGPHISATGLIKCFEITHHSSSYFLGKNTEDSLQRIYGTSFPSKDLYKQYKSRLALAKLRDHRRLGIDHDLFFFNELSPGSCFFLPNGTYIYNTLITFLRSEYSRRGFVEVVTPNIYSTKLWEQSGHLLNYKENMFCFNVDETEFALKPMNCPGHCLMFKHMNRSYKQLPMRVADFGVLHRNELSGALTGLTRVRRFQQDDAHIFCTKEQVGPEIISCLDFLDTVYKRFSFKYEIFLSTRPEKYIGDIAVWEEAENSLRQALIGKAYKVNDGDGAFYGPKIDIVLEDALGRKNQCATIQLDFQLPDRFDLLFTNSAGVPERPVMIHRAILGSVERFIAILLESYGIKLPFWISPFQVAIVCVNDEVVNYCTQLKMKLCDFNCVVFNDQSVTLNKKIRNCEVGGFKVIVVVGVKEVETGSVNVRGKGGYMLEVFRTMLMRMKNEMVEFEEL